MHPRQHHRQRRIPARAGTQVSTHPPPASRSSRTASKRRPLAWQRRREIRRRDGASGMDENEASRSGQDRPPPRLVPFVPSGTLGADARFVWLKGTLRPRRCTAGLAARREPRATERAAVSVVAVLALERKRRTGCPFSIKPSASARCRSMRSGGFRRNTDASARLNRDGIAPRQRTARLRQPQSVAASAFARAERCFSSRATTRMADQHSRAVRDCRSGTKASASPLLHTGFVQTPGSRGRAAVLARHAVPGGQ